MASSRVSLPALPLCMTIVSAPSSSAAQSDF